MFNPVTQMMLALSFVLVTVPGTPTDTPRAGRKAGLQSRPAAEKPPAKALKAVGADGSVGTVKPNPQAEPPTPARTLNVPPFNWVDLPRWKIRHFEEVAVVGHGAGGRSGRSGWETTTRGGPCPIC